MVIITEAEAVVSEETTDSGNGIAGTTGDEIRAETEVVTEVTRIETVIETGRSLEAARAVEVGGKM